MADAPAPPVCAAGSAGFEGTPGDSALLCETSGTDRTCARPAKKNIVVHAQAISRKIPPTQTHSQREDFIWRPLSRARRPAR
jgi:hypothetical protein